MIASKSYSIKGFVLAFGALIYLGADPSLANPSLANPCQGTLAEVFKQIEAVKFIRDDLTQSLRGQELSGSYPWQTNPDHSKVFREFEDDYLKLIELGDPTLLGSAFKSKWGLTEIQFADVISFYSVHIWEDPTLSAFGQDARVRFFDRLRFLHFADFIKNTNKSLGRAYSKKQNLTLLTVKDYFIYFHKNITQMSVPQIADDLNVTENEIYQLLSDLRISIDTKWQSTKFKNLFSEIEVQRGLSGGVLTDDFILETSQKHKVGFEALKFYLHYLGSFQNGRPWSAGDIFKLKELRLQKRLTISEIANSLNRTEASVSAKLSTLGLVANIQKGADLIVQPPYGALKEKGQIQVEALMKFVLGTGFNNRSHLAELLEVQASSFDAFVARHKLDFLFDDFGTRSASLKDSPDSLEGKGFHQIVEANQSEAQRSLRKAQEKFSTQRDFIDKIVAEVLKFDEASESKLKMDPKELLKTYKESIEANFSNDPLLFLEALFSELELRTVAHRVDLWDLSSKETCLQRGSVFQPGIEMRLRALQKRYSDFVILKFLKENPNTDFEWSNGGPKTPFENTDQASKVMGTGIYSPAREQKPAGRSAHKRVHEGPEAFWIHIYNKATESGVGFDLSKVEFQGEYTPEFRKLLTQVWDAKIFKFLKENPNTDFKWSHSGPKTPFESGNQPSKVMGSGIYSPAREQKPAGRNAHKRVHEGPEAFWIHIYNKATESGVGFDLSKVEFNGEYTSEFRKLLIQVWDAKILKFLKENPNTDFEWSHGGPKTPFESRNQASKVMGSGKHSPAREQKPAGRHAHQRVHSGSIEFYQHVSSLLEPYVEIDSSTRQVLLEKLAKRR